MTEEEVFRFISGEGLVEFVPESFEEGERVLRYMRGRHAFLATSDGTFKVTEEIFQELLSKNFRIRRLEEPE